MSDYFCGWAVLATSNAGNGWEVQVVRDPKVPGERWRAIRCNGAGVILESRVSADPCAGGILDILEKGERYISGGV